MLASARVSRESAAMLWDRFVSAAIAPAASVEPAGPAQKTHSQERQQAAATQQSRIR